MEEKPLIDFQERGKKCGHELRTCLTPSLPNLFIADLELPEGEAAATARAATDAIQEEWRNIAQACWKELAGQGLVRAEDKERFERQISRFLTVSWQVTPCRGSYKDTHSLNARHLDAVRHTRDFVAWAKGGWEVGVHQNKDSLTGREEAICGGSRWWEEKIGPLEGPNGSGVWPSVFRRRNAGDFLGAVTLVKRLWHRIYLRKEPWGIQASKDLPVPSTWQVARHVIDNDEDAEPGKANDGPGFFAVLAMDGDEMGKWLSGGKELSVEKKAHRDFSGRLGEFSLRAARGVVQRHGGFLIYSGGDDVLAMLPADTAFACAEELRSKFREVMRQKRIDVSAGIAIAQAASPLQDIVRAAERGAKRAKGGLGRSAVAVTLVKGSGELVEWGARWDSGGMELCKALAAAISSEEVSAKFPHRVLELLTPYLTHQTGISRQKDAEGFDAAEVIRREFGHVIGRQSKGKQGAAVLERIMPLLETYLRGLAMPGPDREGEKKTNTDSQNQRLLKSMIGLCQTAVFAAAHKSTKPDSRGRAS